MAATSYRKVKYITILTHSDCECAIIFDQLLIHAEMRPDDCQKILGAGFCNIVDNKVQVYGKSESLKIESRPEDELLIRRAINW